MNTLSVIWLGDATSNKGEHVMSPHEALMPANSEKFMGDQLHRLDMRKGKFSRGAFYASAAGYFMSPSPAAAWTMASVNAYYRAESKTKTSDKCIYNQLDKYEALPGAELVVKQMLKGLERQLRRKVKIYARRCGDPAALCRRMGVSGIVICDGCEAPVIPSVLSDTEGLGNECYGKSRPKADGSAPRPAIKLHVAYSLVRRCFVYVAVTGACGSERDMVPCDLMKDQNVLFVMDRGYCGEDLEKSITDSGNQFLIRDRGNRKAEIVGCVKDGAPVKEPPADTSKAQGGLFDCTVKRKSDGAQVREIIARNGEKDMSLRTSLSCTALAAEAAGPLYRLRWQIELFNKCLKSGSGLRAINSGKVRIILQFVMICLMACILKTWLMMTAQSRAKEDCDISALKTCIKIGKLYADLTKAIATKGRTTVWARAEEMIETIINECVRTRPGKRDRREGRDLRLQTEAVLKSGPQEIVNEIKVA